MIDVFDAPLESANILAGYIIASINVDFGRPSALHPMGGEWVIGEDIQSFSDLHDYCDANEYIALAAEAFGWEFDLNSDDDVTVINVALDIADQWIKGQVTPEPVLTPSDFDFSATPF